MKLLKRLFQEKKMDFPAEVLPRRLSLLDVGARGGVQWPWDCVARSLVSMVLVEPDPIEAEKLQHELGVDAGVVLPVALWRDDTTLTLNLNSSPGTSSVYPANRAFLNQFPELSRFDLIKTLDIPAVAIDSLAAAGRIPDIDFAKIDVQGAELAILEGGRHHLAANLVGLEVEVEFAELYSGQPLFGDVEAFVREELGLELWDLRKTYWKYEQGRHAPGAPKGRLIFGDALFFRPLSGLEAWLASMSPAVATEKVIMLVFASLAYGYVDYAATLLRAPLLEQYVPSPIRLGLQRAMHFYGRGFRPASNGCSSLFAILEAFARAFQPTHAGWASGGRGLGSRRRGPFWV